MDDVTKAYLRDLVAQIRWGQHQVRLTLGVAKDGRLLEELEQIQLTLGMAADRIDYSLELYRQ